VLKDLQGHSIKYRIALGPHKGRPAFKPVLAQSLRTTVLQRHACHAQSPAERVLWRRGGVLPAYATAISSARHAVRIAGRTEASAQCFDEPNGNVRLLAFEQGRALIGNQQLLTGDQWS
jgi:hypothetical protein